MQLRMGKLLFVARLVVLYPAAWGLGTYVVIAAGNTFLGLKLDPAGASIVIVFVWYFSVLLGAKDLIEKFRRMD
jgi:hypothetical protein